MKLAAGLLAGLVVIAAAVPPRLTWAALHSLELSTDSGYETLVKEDPLNVLGNTRAVYLDGYGVVFSTEVELSPSSAPNPFRPRFTKEDVQRLREKKKVRVSFLKESMQNRLVELAHGLDMVPLTQNVALAVTIPYFRWESTEGMPRQIVMTAPRGALLEARTGNAGALSSALKVQELY